MRFSVDIFFNNKESVKLPLTYRKDIASLIKEALKVENSNYFYDYYGEKSKNKQKPFTFSIYMPNLVKEEKENLLVLQDNKLSLNFSSNDYPFFISIYNGLLKLKNFKLFDTNITVKHFYLKKEIPFDKKMIFKTFTPILLRDIENKKGKGYLSYDNPKFIEQSKYTIKNLVKYFLKMEIDINNINFTPMKMKSEIVHLYGGEIGNSGIFMLEAPKEVIKLVYDIGLGAKRSQGFGMIDVVG